MTDKPTDPAVRGLIAGEDSVPLDQVKQTFKEALAPTDRILAEIERVTRTTPEDS